MAKQSMATAPVREGCVHFLGLRYAGAGLDRLRHQIGDELTEVEVAHNPQDLRSISVRHRPTGYLCSLRCTDQIYAAMTTVAVQTTLVRRAAMRALAHDLGRATRGRDRVAGNGADGPASGGGDGLTEPAANNRPESEPA